MPDFLENVWKTLVIGFIVFGSQSDSDFRNMDGYYFDYN